MATIRTAIALYDGVTSPLQSMNNAMNIVINSFESMQRSSERAVDTGAIQEAREELARAGAAFDSIEQNIRDADQAQNDFNDSIQGGASAADGLLDKMKGILATVIGIAGIKIGLGWAKENMELADIQRNAENQLRAVLDNMRVADVTIPGSLEVQTDIGQTMSAFDAITAKASEIQGRGIYGDEAMIAGAAEFGTYFSDAEAIIAMMDTLSNYAIGMSGGGAIDSQAMVDYATGLGKIMSGSYEAMTKKGFEFTDAQKAIVEGTATQVQIVEALGAEYLDASADVQAAAAINSVIAESWDGLYKAMSNTPEGVIIQFNNRLGDLREALGNQIYPYVLKFYGAFSKNFPQVEQVLVAFTGLLGRIITVLGWIIEGALTVGSAIVGNWSWIAPIIMGVVGAYLALHGAVIAYNTVTAISNGIEAVKAARLAMTTVATGAQTTATFAQTVAQYGLNAALLACPITWIIVGIIALVALFYAAVAAVNHFAGTSYSATGMICGAFMAALAFIGNLFVAVGNLIIDVFVLIYNLVATVANFIGNVFVDPVGAVCRLFFDLADTVLGVLQSLAGAIDAIFGSDFSGAVQGWRDSLGGWVDDTFDKGEEMMSKMNADDLKLGRFEYGAAYDLGYSFGEGIDNIVSGMFKMPSLDEMGFDNFGNALDGIYGNTGDTANNTAANADALDITAENLAYLRDIAEREAINRFTTAEVKVDMTGMSNKISSEMDIDGIFDQFGEKFAEIMDSSAVGVHE